MGYTKNMDLPLTKLTTFQKDVIKLISKNYESQNKAVEVIAALYMTAGVKKLCVLRGLTNQFNNRSRCSGGISEHISVLPNHLMRF